MIVIVSPVLKEIFIFFHVFIVFGEILLYTSR